MTFRDLKPLFIGLLSITLLVGCDETSSDDTNDADSAMMPEQTVDGGLMSDASPNPDGQTVPEGSTTYWQHVVPILDQNCMGCHKTNGIAPMKFDSYDSVKTWGPAIVASTQARTMPPWLANGDGSCGEFADSEWLKDEDLNALATWVDEGMLEGTPTERIEPETRELNATHSFMTPNFIPERQGGIFAQYDEYRCFRYTFDDMDQDHFLTGYEVLPGNEAIVHHVIGVIVNPNRRSRVDGLSNAEQMQALDDESPDREGWPCFVGAGESVRENSEPIAWAPGQGVMTLPEGTGVRIAAGFELILQVHYNLANDADQGSSDQTLVNVSLEREVETRLRPVYIDYFLANIRNNFIPRGEADYEFKREAPFRNLGERDPIKIWGVLPHMHERGQKLNATLLRADAQDNQCAVQVDNWDFAWQRTYWYDEPIEANPEDEWQITCNFDSEDATSAVLPGWGTRNEMCLTVLYVSTNEEAMSE